MSLTEAEFVFAGVNESGANGLLQAFFTARPRYLSFSTPALAALGPHLPQPPITFPGLPGAIQYRVDLTIPRIDFDPDSTGGGSPLPIGAQQVGISTTVILTVGCQRRRREGDDQPGSVTPIRAKLDIWARGRVVAAYFGPGSGEISFQVDEIEIVDISPDELESVFECLMLMVLQAVLSAVRIPFNVLSAGAFSLSLLRGPEVEDDQVKVYGSV
jgi:hypothetical protein